MKNRVTMLLVLTMILLTSCRTVPLLNPGRLTVQCSSRDNMRYAIMEALTRRHWVVSQEQPDSIEATLLQRNHTAKIRIKYDVDSFDISFLDSTGLKYEKKANGSETIHKNYNAWIRYLVHDISAYARRAG